jgi:hypothetical protein
MFFLFQIVGYAQCPSLDYYLDGANTTKIISYLNRITYVDSSMKYTVNKTFSHIQNSKSFYKSEHYREATQELIYMLQDYINYLKQKDERQALAVFETIRAQAIADHVTPPTIAVLSNFFLPTKSIRATSLWQKYLDNTALDMPDNYYNNKRTSFSLIPMLYSIENACLEGTSFVNWKIGPSIDQYNHFVGRFNRVGASGKDDDEEGFWDTIFDWIKIEIALFYVKINARRTKFSEDIPTSVAGVRGIVGEEGGIDTSSFGRSISSILGKYMKPAHLPRIKKGILEPIMESPNLTPINKSGFQPVQPQYKPYTPKPSRTSQFKKVKLLKKIALRAYNGKYVCADKGLNGQMIANRTAIGPWETFELIPQGGNKYALKTSYGKYVCADLGLGGKLYANRDRIGPWETFEIIELGGEKIALKASNGKYVCADRGLGDILIANRDNIGEWETFYRIDKSLKSAIPTRVNPSTMKMFSQLKYGLRKAINKGRSISSHNFTQTVRKEFFKSSSYRELSRFSQVKIRDIVADPDAGERVLTSGGSLLVIGDNFGSKQGSISIVLNSPVSGRTRFDLLPGDSRGWSYNWRDNVIYARIPKIAGFMKPYSGRLIINSRIPQSLPAEISITLIPKTTIIQISGRNYFRLDKKDKMDRYMEIENNYLLVVHDPGCGVKGNEGNDYFDFRGLYNKSPFFKIKKAIVVQIDPKNEQRSYMDMVIAVKEVYDIIKGNFKSVIMYEV